MGRWCLFYMYPFLALRLLFGARSSFVYFWRGVQELIRSGLFLFGRLFGRLKLTTVVPSLLFLFESFTVCTIRTGLDEKRGIPQTIKNTMAIGILYDKSTTHCRLNVSVSLQNLCLAVEPTILTTMRTMKAQHLRCHPKSCHLFCRRHSRHRRSRGCCLCCLCFGSCCWPDRMLPHLLLLQSRILAAILAAAAAVVAVVRPMAWCLDTVVVGHCPDQTQAQDHHPLLHRPRSLHRAGCYPGRRLDPDAHPSKPSK